MSKEISRDLIVKSSYAELYNHILDGIENKKSIMIWGDPGIGKTSIAYHISELLKYNLELVILSSKTQYDVAGMPINVDGDDIAENIVKYSMPEFIYNSRKVFKETGKHTVFLFDEINTADRFTLAPAYQYLQERGVGNDKFHDNDIVIASGNYDNTGGLTEKMPLPLANRVKHIYLEVKAEDWIKIYASKNNIHPLIVSFYQKAEHNRFFMNFNYEELNASECKSFASPRSIESMSDDLYTYFRNVKGENSTDNRSNIDFVRSKVKDYLIEDYYESRNSSSYNSIVYNESYLLALIQSHIGIEAGFKFYEWVELGSKLPSAEDFLDNKIDDKNLVADLGDGLNDVFYIFANSICIHLKSIERSGGDPTKYLNRYVSFIDDNFGEVNFSYAVVVLIMIIYKIKFNHDTVNNIDRMFEVYKKVV